MNESDTESELGRRYQSDKGPGDVSTPGTGAGHEIKIGRTVLLTEEHGKEVKVEVFTMTLGAETIPLVPLRNWGQLDVYKWTVRGKLPGTPAGLEITPEHAKLAGQTVPVNDPDGCAKLETLFSDWLEVERKALELARKNLQRRHTAVAQDKVQPPEAQRVHFQVEVGKGGQVHINCLQGKELVNSIGLNQPGFGSLVSQGIMTRPHKLKVGVLHDWVELDGELCSFEKGNNEAAKLEKLLNERYVPSVALGQGKEVVVLANPASSTGFDVQFPVTVGGTTEFRRRPLNEESLEILQDPSRCGLLQPEIIIKLARPNLIFKHKTRDGGEQYLESTVANTVVVRDDAGEEKSIDLSRPVNCLRLGAPELTAIFNHPAINRHGKSLAQPVSLTEAQAKPAFLEILPQPAATVMLIPPPEEETELALAPSPAGPIAEEIRVETQPLPAKQAVLEANNPQEVKVEALPNAWLESVLARPPIRYDWLASLTYNAIAERIGNSSAGKLGPTSCWGVALGEITDMDAPEYKGIFLTEKNGLGFINQGHMARFRNGVVVIGTPESAIEGIGITLIGVGLDLHDRVIFLVANGYEGKFGISPQALKQELAILNELGAVILSVKEALESRETIAILWTVPADQDNPSDPQAFESVNSERPES